MAHLQHARGLHHVESAGQIAVDIGARGFEAIAHARLGGEVDDDVRARLLCGLHHGVSILKHRLGLRKA